MSTTPNDNRLFTQQDMSSQILYTEKKTREQDLHAMIGFVVVAALCGGFFGYQIAKNQNNYFDKCVEQVLKLNKGKTMATAVSYCNGRSY